MSFEVKRFCHHVLSCYNTIKLYMCLNEQNLQTTQELTVAQMTEYVFNSLLNDKHLDLTKLKTFEDDKTAFAIMRSSVFYRVGNVVEAENAGYQHFLFFFLQSFQKLFSGL